MKLFDTSTDIVEMIDDKFEEIGLAVYGLDLRVISTTKSKDIIKVSKASATAETAETEPSAETKEPEEETKPEETDKVSGKKNLPAILLGIACVIELIIIILLLIFRTRGVV